MSDAAVPAANYLIVASRLVPDLDGGFTVSVTRRARDIAAATDGPSPLLLTVDPGERATHDAHRAEWTRRGILNDDTRLRNLFDDVRVDADWARAAAEALPVPAADDVPYRAITDGLGRTVLEIPYGIGGSEWHLTDAPVRVWDAAGTAPIGWLRGYGGLYRAWIASVAASEKARTGLESVVVCEARQIGELLAAGIGIPVVHTTHAAHVRAPFSWDSPIDPAWQRWFAVADRFDAVLWLTAAQQRDVQRRVGDGIRSFVVPHPAPAVTAPAEPVPGRIVMLNSLIPRKRIDHALHALARVREGVPHAHLEVYGAGGSLDALSDLAGELGITGAVTWHGHSSTPEEAWGGADAFLFTSENEGQGLVLLEALSHGVPVVAYDAPYGPADALADGGGVLVPSGDLAALTGALQSVLARRELRAELSLLAQRAAARRDAAASMNAFGQVISAVLGRV
ncbi:poly(glycerol-phosphate) alpha-glucosyltransferase [Microbacterium endophyticum]|uniref:Poly(Glycerol-phosphate) alpha-glucosyltransferase n=1 Tax=Microbacterium endophyticum TaxID=1526412 RepID=A0A7W4YLN8_9MICO|nr:glycosyltransferase [Microbacterium endophyticum]MBB2975625.1 poly(glycerol-phosphate) alpha-glucosyltransferase [Microbacterium endophyticum]NIK35356.1 poly(glycerol-phosphate) alpha-glucosyltransferase [Microbacterium endophyticum]